jgi:hypothetical protein
MIRNDSGKWPGTSIAAWLLHHSAIARARLWRNFAIRRDRPRSIAPIITPASAAINPNAIRSISPINPINPIGSSR